MVGSTAEGKWDGPWRVCLLGSIKLKMSDASGVSHLSSK